MTQPDKNIQFRQSQIDELMRKGGAPKSFNEFFAYFDELKKKAEELLPPWYRDGAVKFRYGRFMPTNRHAGEGHRQEGVLEALKPLKENLPQADVVPFPNTPEKQKEMTLRSRIVVFAARTGPCSSRQVRKAFASHNKKIVTDALFQLVRKGLLKKVPIPKKLRGKSTTRQCRYLYEATAAGKREVG